MINFTKVEEKTIRDRLEKAYAALDLESDSYDPEDASGFVAEALALFNKEFSSFDVIDGEEE